MPAVLLDGVSISRVIRDKAKARVSALHKGYGVTPGLAVILVGDDPASKVYVSHKVKACAEIGIRSELHSFRADVLADTIVGQIERLNGDPATHGILVQLPLPAHLDIQHILRTIAAEKDVDGFHLYNVGGLVIGDTVFSALHAIWRD